ncbi:40S ribosomal protein s13 [Aulographum hederae CBS 113979]|uniref:40S ribosomal protein s13 n=1 Tax=Aulographum hederae CBS 113979 TaxID=1176131 RepID=A0A6G1GV12_9PEZI|nr:40S ribosomal protein s13 [Aulographum hederae CBS 113979]
MPYILGTNFLETQFVKSALESFYGVGPKVSQRLMARYYIHPTAKIGALKQQQIMAIQEDLSNMTIGNDARRILKDTIMRLKEMGTYRGRRHALNLPVRGQNTRSQIVTARKHNRIVDRTHG